MPRGYDSVGLIMDLGLALFVSPPSSLPHVPRPRPRQDFPEPVASRSHQSCFGAAPMPYSIGRRHDEQRFYR